MNTTELKQQLKATRKECEKLEKLIAEEEKPKGRYLPKVGDTYYFLDSRFVSTKAVWGDYTSDKELYSSFDVFRTEKEALAVRADRLRANAYSMACRIVEPDFVPVWTDQSLNYYPVFDCMDNEYAVSGGHSFVAVATSYVSSAESAEKVIALLKEWGVK